MRFVKGIYASTYSLFFFFFLMHADYTVSHALCTIQALFRRHYALFSGSRALFMGPSTTIFRKKTLKIGPKTLFTHLKIILLQYFQFSVFSKVRGCLASLFWSLNFHYSSLNFSHPLGIITQFPSLNIFHTICGPIPISQCSFFFFFFLIFNFYVFSTQTHQS